MGDNLSMDGENSSDCGVVPSVPFIDRDINIDNGGFNLLQAKSLILLRELEFYMSCN